MHKPANYRRLLIHVSDFLRCLQTLHLHDFFYSIFCHELYVCWQSYKADIFQEIEMEFTTYTFLLFIITSSRQKPCYPL